MSNSQPVIFRVNALRRRFLYGLALLLILPPLALVVAGMRDATSDIEGAGFVLGLILAMPAALLAFLGRRTRLIVHKDGLNLHNLGLHASIPWSDVERIEKTRRQEGIVLREPSNEKWARRQRSLTRMSYAGNPLHPPMITQLSSEMRFVDLRPFSIALHSAAFNEAVARFSPKGAKVSDSAVILV